MSTGNFVCFPASGQVGHDINKFDLNAVSFFCIIAREIISAHFWETIITHSELSRQNIEKKS